MAGQETRAGDKGGASKYDANKIPLYQGFKRYFPRAALAVALVSEYGFRKYGTWGGWHDVPDGVNRYTDAKSRHDTMQDIEGPYDDLDSGLAHAAQEAWNALAKLELALEQGQIELRRGNEIEFVNGKPQPILGTAKKVLDVTKSA